MVVPIGDLLRESIRVDLKRSEPSYDRTEAGFFALEEDGDRFKLSLPEGRNICL